MRWTPVLAALCSLTLSLAATSAEEVSDRTPLALKVVPESDRLVFSRDSLPVATYVFRDPEILRPYFAHLHTPGGVRITRNLPPLEGVDPADHPTMHPGVWLAFGDLSGEAGGGDFWRNKGRVEHVEFTAGPQAKMDGPDGVVTFTAKNRYLLEDKVICYELARHTIRATQSGYLIAFDSEFSGDEPFVFGDQEEMGLGVRLATPATVKGGGGAITNSEGRTNEKEVWGRQADWCDYSGILTTTAQANGAERKLRAGLLVAPHPDNLRRSWMHARDYGVLVANPFGRNAFTKGEKSRLEVRPGERLRLRFGVWSYAAKLDEKVDWAGMAAEYVKLSGER